MNGMNEKKFNCLRASMVAQPCELFSFLTRCPLFFKGDATIKGDANGKIFRSIIVRDDKRLKAVRCRISSLLVAACICFQDREGMAIGRDDSERLALLKEKRFKAFATARSEGLHSDKPEHEGW